MKEPSSDIETLLAAEPSQKLGNDLAKWADSGIARSCRGDMALGILTIEDAQKVPLALSKAAICGVPMALLTLARWHRNPPLGEPDIVLADGILNEAIGKGVPGAKMEMVHLRWFFRRDEATNEERNETCNLCRQLIDEDHQDSEAIHYLGLLTTAGFGIEADPTAAQALQRRAADLGNTDAMFELYVHYTNGLGVAKDDQKAFSENHRAAQSGHPRAMYNMGVFYATGHVVDKDMAKAAEWYEKAGDAGNPHALANLATLYIAGNGVEEDRDYAEDLINQAEYLGLDVSELRESLGF